MNDTTEIARILKYIQTGKAITPLFALNKFGCFRLADVMFKLGKRGYNIKRKTKAVKGQNGKVKRFTEYWLDMKQPMFNTLADRKADTT